MTEKHDQEVLEALERGEPINELRPGSSEVATRYTRIKDALQTMDSRPPAEGWQEAVRNRIRIRATRRHRMRRVAMPIAAAVTGIALATWLVWRPPATPISISDLEVRVEDTGTETVRAAGARLGDSLVVSGATDAPNVEIRVYFNERELVFRCGEESPCNGQPRHPEATVRMTRRGRYQAVLLAAAQPHPPPQGDLDEDTAAALQAGGEAELSPVVEVR